VRAHGFEPSRITPGPIPPDAAAPGGVCPYAWSFLHSVVHYPGAAAALFTTRCDQMRRVAETASREGDMPVFLMNVPATQTAAARGLYVSELRRMGRFLESLGGTAPSGEMIAHACRECRSETDVPAREDSGDKVRLALIGGPSAGDMRRLSDLCERAGGTIVLDATVTGELARQAPLDLEAVGADFPEALAAAYFGAIPDAFRRPNDPFYDWLSSRLAERGVQGAVFRYWTWCDKWHAEAQRLKEWADVPVVVTTATGEGIDGHAASRIEALVEMLR